MGIDTSDAAGGSFSYAGSIGDSANGPLALTKLGAGTLVLAGYNTYSGLTEVASGTLQAGAEYALSPSSDMTVNSGAVLDMNGFDNEVNTLSGAGTVENSASGTSVTLGVGVDSTETDEFDGTLTDAGGGTGQLGLAKLGADTFTLAGTNAFTGPTIVEGGILNVATAFGNSPVQLAGGRVQGNDAPTPTSFATTVTLALGAGASNPSVTGQSVAFTATVSTVNSGYGPPSGTVDFYDEATGDDSGSIRACRVAWQHWTLTNPDAGDHYIVATYTSNSNTFVGGTVGEFDQTVNPADTATTVSIADSTNPQDGGNPGYGDAITITATVTPPQTGGSIPAIRREQQSRDGRFLRYGDGPIPRRGGLEPQQRRLGHGHLVRHSGNTANYNLGIGSYSIIAVYSGDDNFDGSQSAGTAMNVVGNGVSLAGLSVTPPTYGYGDYRTEATLSDTSSADFAKLDGQAFSVTVNWGDGTAAETDYYAAGTTSFSIGQYYAPTGRRSPYQLQVTLTSGDGRDVTVNPTVASQSVVTVSVVQSGDGIEGSGVIPPDNWFPPGN